MVGGVIFGVDETFPGSAGECIDVAYRLGQNEWNGTTTVELKIIDGAGRGSSCRMFEDIAIVGEQTILA